MITPLIQCFFIAYLIRLFLYRIKVDSGGGMKYLDKRHMKNQRRHFNTHGSIYEPKYHDIHEYIVKNSMSVETSHF